MSKQNIALTATLLGFGFSVFWSLLGGLVFPFYRPETAGSLRRVVKQAKEFEVRDSDA